MEKEYEDILNHLRLKHREGDSFASMQAYLQRKEVPAEVVKVLVSQVLSEGKTTQNHHKDLIRATKRKHAIIQGLKQLGVGVAVLVFALLYNAAAINKAGRMPMVMLFAMAIGGIVALIGLIRIIIMATKRAEEFDYM